jgi:uncharacterized protein DUF1236
MAVSARKRMLGTVALALLLAMSTAVAQQYGGERQSGAQGRGAGEPAAQAPREPTYDAATGRMQQPSQQGTQASERAQQGQQPSRQGAQARDQRQPGAQEGAQAPRQSQRQSGPGAESAQTGQAQTTGQAPQEGARATRQGQRQLQPGRGSAETTGQASQEGARGARSSRGSAQESAQAPADARSTVSLNDQQRTRISTLISRQNVRPLDRVNFSVSVGTVVPRSVRLQPLSADIVAIVPQFRGHRFLVVEDEIVIVEPSTFRIVAVIPRRTAAVSTTSRAQVATTSRLQLTQQQRESIRTHVLRESPRIATREKLSIAVGEPVSSSIELRTFQDTVVSDVPVIRPFRFFVQDRDVVLVDPAEHRIVEVIR